MSVLIKDKKQPYNDNHFYRANPYANQGYIPTPALKNRKQPEFITQIPQGIDFFEPSAKKHFVQISNKSEIADLHLFQTPERYPLENTLANDIEYDRNLNTIDIEGANPNTKKNKALRNRIKAQEQLLRRNAPIINPILATGVSQEERRRKLAQQQLQRQNSRGSDKKSSYRKHQSQKKLLPMGRYIRNPYIQMKDQEIEVDMTTLEKELKMRQKPEQEPLIYSNPEIVTHNYHKHPEQQLGGNQAQQSINKLTEAKLLKHNQGRHNSYDANSEGSRGIPGSASSSNLNVEIQQYFQRQRKNIQRQLLSKQLRQINPTNLSYEGSVVRNSSIFSTLGKNLALK